MLKKHAHAFVALLWLFDMAVLALSFLVAYLVRFFLPWFEVAQEPRSLVGVSLELFVIALPIWTFCLHVFSLYQPRRTESRILELFALAKTTCVATLLLVSAQYFS